MSQVTKTARMGHKLAALLAAGGLALWVRAETLYPVYTVTTEGDGIATNLLEDCTVQIVDSDGATPRQVAYADIDKSAGNFHGTFVIDAASYLMGSVTMTNFTGEIYIRRGALIVDAVGWLGVATTAQAPKLYVENGASLVPTCPVTRGGKIYNELHLSGTGYNGIGAFCNRYRASHSDYCFYNSIYLEADTTIGMDSYSRVDMNGNYGRLVLNDHTLTIKDIHAVRIDTKPNFCTYTARVQPGAGHIVLDHVSLQVQGRNADGWLGGPTNTLTLINNANISYYITYVPIKWTVVIGAENGGYGFSDSGDASSPANFPNRKWNSYEGPIHVDGRLYTPHHGYSYSGLSLLGDIYGNGWIDSPGGGWLQLGGSNTYSGTTTVRNGNYTGLALWREESASTLSAGYYVTNAPIRLVADGRRTGRADLMYDLPPINYHITAGKSFELGATHSETNVVEDLTVRGGMDARIASLKKTGDGELSLLANFDITGRTEIVAGTVHLAPANTYSAAPGLWEGIFETNETVQAEFLAKFQSGEWKTDDIPIKKQYNDTTLVLSNRIVSSVYLFGQKRSPHWHYLMAPVYHGYIWNRTSEPVTVTLVGSIIDAWYIGVRGSKVASLYDSSRLAKGTATLQPGPNAIMVRGWVRNNGSAGWMVPSKMPNWAPYMGFAMAYGTTDTEYNASDYFVPTNGAAACAGGDGFMFTRDARAPEDFTAEELATTRTTITDLAMHPGAYLDLAGSPLFIKTLEGSGSITNGDLTVKERWSLGLSSISASPLYLDGALAFGEGAVVEFNGEGARLSHDQAVEKPIVNALGGISGSPTFASQSNWKLKLSGDGKSLVAVYYPVGTKFILR